MDLSSDLDLRDRIRARQGQDVHQLGELDSVAGDERQPLEQDAAAGELARERLHQPGQRRPVHVEQGARDEFGNPPTTAGQQAARQRPVVGRLDIGHLPLGQQGPQQPGHHLGVEVLQVRVDENHNISGRGVQGLPQSFTLARDPPVAGQDPLLGDHHRTRGGRLGRGRVDRPRIDDNDLVNERHPDNKIAMDRRNDRADRGGLVQSGQHHADRTLLAGQQPDGREVTPVIRSTLEPTVHITPHPVYSTD